jgi:hypothetical protein
MRPKFKLQTTVTILSYHRLQHKVIKHLTQLLHPVLLKTHKTLQPWCLLAGTVHTVYYMAFLLLTDEQDVKHLNLLAHMQKKCNAQSILQFSEVNGTT